jgi:hypothetical protein
VASSHRYEIGLLDIPFNLLFVGRDELVGFDAPLVRRELHVVARELPAVSLERLHVMAATLPCGRMQNGHELALRRMQTRLDHLGRFEVVVIAMMFFATTRPWSSDIPVNAHFESEDQHYIGHLLFVHAEEPLVIFRCLRDGGTKIEMHGCFPALNTTLRLTQCLHN